MAALVARIEYIGVKGDDDVLFCSLDYIAPTAYFESEDEEEEHKFSDAEGGHPNLSTQNELCVPYNRTNRNVAR